MLEHLRLIIPILIILCVSTVSIRSTFGKGVTKIELFGMTVACVTIYLCIMAAILALLLALLNWLLETNLSFLTGFKWLLLIEAVIQALNLILWIKGDRIAKSLIRSLALAAVLVAVALAAALGMLVALAVSAIP